jgi:hypothetical protein
MIKFSTSNEDFPTVVGDEFADPLTQFKSTYEDIEISWDVNFSVPEDDGTGETFNVDSVTVSSNGNDGITFSGSGAALSASGKVTNVFLGEKFSFMLRDKTNITDVSKDTIGNYDEIISRKYIDWATITSWAPPPIKQDSINYTFEVSYTGSISMASVKESITIEQLVYWNLTPGLSAFQSLV